MENQKTTRVVSDETKTSTEVKTAVISRSGYTIDDAMCAMNFLIENNVLDEVQFFLANKKHKKYGYLLGEPIFFAATDCFKSAIEAFLDYQEWFCKCCNKNCMIDDKDYYMLQHNLWKSIHPEILGMLCMDCVEEKLGRKLLAIDVLDCPLTRYGNPYTSALLNGL